MIKDEYFLWDSLLWRRLILYVYSKKSRQDAIDGMYCMIPYTPDFDMLSLMCETLKKLQSISNEEFESYDFEEIVE